MAKPKPITLNWLKSQGACGDQVKVFEQVFGMEAELTEANAAKAIEANLDLDWLVKHLLTAPARTEYRRATAAVWTEYDQAIAIAKAEYDQVVAPARTGYRRATAAVWTEYDQAMTIAWAEYDQVMAPAWAECKRAMAIARTEYDQAIAIVLLALLADPANHK